MSQYLIIRRKTNREDYFRARLPLYRPTQPDSARLFVPTQAEATHFKVLGDAFQKRADLDTPGLYVGVCSDPDCPACGTTS